MMRVLIAFNDVTLGGTSRSGVAFARLWKTAGADVQVYTPHGVHPGRDLDLRQIGITPLSDAGALCGDNIDLVHLHHPAPNADTLRWIGNLVDRLGSAPAYLTHNIFGQPLPIELPSRTVIGVLGHWVGWQLRGQGGATLPVRRIPNPQDYDFFRIPTDDERVAARTRLGIRGDQIVVLRAGSPSAAKWNLRDYASLVDRASNEHVLRFIGAPNEMKPLARDGVTLVHTPLDDEELRQEYWAADVFAHSAQRGESFGNVLLEAIASGVPVAYRAQVTRDNTPAEFRGIAGFDYATSSGRWLGSIFARRERLKRAARHSALWSYGLSAVEELLAQVVEAADESGDAYEAVIGVLPKVGVPSFASYAAIALRHNRIAAVLKRARLGRL